MGRTAGMTFDEWFPRMDAALERHGIATPQERQKVMVDMLRGILQQPPGAFVATVAGLRGKQT